MPSANRRRKTKSPTSKFHPFPKLSFEIRSMIWALSIEPRIFHFSFEAANTADGDDNLVISITCPHLNLLETSREARSEVIRAMSRYGQPFHDHVITQPDVNVTWVAKLGVLNFNYAPDIVYIDVPHPPEFGNNFGEHLDDLVREILKEEVILGGQIKSLAINYALLASSYWRQFPKESLTSPIWKSLQHLVVVKAWGEKKDLDTDVLLRDMPVDCPWSREVMKTVGCRRKCRI
ncbi:hypothetical protein L207DRAFT_602581 [Hyaloscypha variabilis F]|uniref:2EXR domain-containing protein n=1 Tax=Hyaloscypha variabilis (strain UAMH 11265 / GT02V1 / F) TaxID=1149755 RepID=A0A2J6R9F1_HYAVF|nr:hypothetical protein L207DRAFT_602581 [Hyaloscypha variabilis F]